MLDEKTRGPTTVVNGAHKGGVTGMCCCTSSSSSSSGSSAVEEGPMLFATGGGSDGTIKLWRSTSSSSQNGASSGSGSGSGSGGGDSFAVCYTVGTETCVETLEEPGSASCRALSLSGCSGGRRIVACGGGARDSVLVYDVVGMSGKITMVLLFRADGHGAPPCVIQAGRCFLEGSIGGDSGDSWTDFAISADKEGCFRTWSIASRRLLSSTPARADREP